MKTKDFSKLREKYLKHKGVICPYCDSDNIEAGALDYDIYDANVIYQNVKCNTCGKEWTDENTLTGVTFMEEYLNPEDIEDINDSL